MMEAFVTPSHRLGASERSFMVTHLTNKDSEFQQALIAGTQAGTICLCLDQGEIVGWARVESWFDGELTRHAVCAFTGPQYRSRGIATFCVMGLVASGLFADAIFAPAIFNRSMAGVASRAGLSALLYVKEGDKWIKATT